MNKTQNGNVLFLILIAVALFAALSYAVTRTQSSGSDGVSDEKLRLDLTTLEQITQSYQVAMQRMVYLNGFDPSEISFVNQIWPAYLNSSGQGENPKCLTEACKLFSPQGGRVIYSEPPESLRAERDFWVFTNRAYLPGIGDEDKTDYIAAFKTTTEKCIKTNEIYGIENPSNAPPNLPGSGGVFSTANGNTPPPKTGQTTFPEELRGQYAGCVNQQHAFYSGISPWIYFVILAL